MSCRQVSNLPFSVQMQKSLLKLALEVDLKLYLQEGYLLVTLSPNNLSYITNFQHFLIFSEFLKQTRVQVQSFSSSKNSFYFSLFIKFKI